jgi:cytochrome P450
VIAGDGDEMIHYPFDPEWATDSARAFTDYVTPLLAARRREPGDDMISMLVSETTDDGEILTDD